MTDAPPPLPDDPRLALDRAMAHLLSALKSINHANTRAAIEKMHSSKSPGELSELVQAVTNAQHRLMTVQRSFIDPPEAARPAAPNGSQQPALKP